MTFTIQRDSSSLKQEKGGVVLSTVFNNRLSKEKKNRRKSEEQRDCDGLDSLEGSWGADVVHSTLKTNLFKLYNYTEPNMIRILLED